MIRVNNKELYKESLKKNKMINLKLVLHFKRIQLKIR